MARDRFGARPLCFSTADERFVFASEYKALLAVPSIPARPDRDAIQYLQCAKFVSPDATLLQ
jgi:asparagine synthase (glutamine-hydrolysing)